MTEPESHPPETPASPEKPAVPEKPAAQVKDPMKSFRGVLAGSLIMEAITVALALPVVARLGGGFGTITGWSVLAIALALILCCGLLRRPYAIPAVLVLQLALIAFVATLPAVAVIGVLFLALFLWLLWLRRDVARRMAAGTLPSQRPAP